MMTIVGNRGMTREGDTERAVPRVPADTDRIEQPHMNGDRGTPDDLAVDGAEVRKSDRRGE